MNIAEAFGDPGQLLAFSWFTPGRVQLQIYGFFVMVSFGAIYYVLPRLLEGTLVWPKLVRLHFWVSAAGVVLTAIPFAVAGMVQAANMLKASIPFVEIARATLPFLRVSTVGELLLVGGNLFLLFNIMASVVQLVRAHFSRTYEVATEDLFKPAEARG
jgi:cytochrome c oxidase cbb3-type subunit 1